MKSNYSHYKRIPPFAGIMRCSHIHTLSNENCRDDDPGKEIRMQLEDFTRVFKHKVMKSSKD
jgi:hypothetical protein